MLFQRPRDWRDESDRSLVDWRYVYFSRVTRSEDVPEHRASERRAASARVIPKEYES